MICINFCDKKIKVNKLEEISSRSIPLAPPHSAPTGTRPSSFACSCHLIMEYSPRQHGLRRCVEGRRRIWPLSTQTVHLYLTFGIANVFSDASSSLRSSNTEMALSRRWQTKLKTLQVPGELLCLGRFYLQWSAIYYEFYVNRDGVESSLWSDIQE